MSTLTKPRPAEASRSGVFNELSVADTLSALRQRVYAIGETTGELAEWDAIIEEAALHITSRMEDSANLAELIVADERGLTPLMVASRNGYHRIVEALLQFDDVREHIGDAESSGLTAWQLSNVAQELTAGALNSSAARNPFRIIPLMVKSPYYANLEFSPYHRTRALLEAAGAEKNIEGVREMLLGLPLCPDDVKAAVRESDDILTTLRELVIPGGPYEVVRLMEALQSQAQQ